MQMMRVWKVVPLVVFVVVGLTVEAGVGTAVQRKQSSSKHTIGQVTEHSFHSL